MAETLDELADLVVPLFADVENKNVDVPQWLDHPYGPDQIQVSVAPGQGPCPGQCHTWMRSRLASHLDKVQISVIPRSVSHLDEIHINITPRYKLV